MKKLPFFLSKITTNAYCQQPRTLSFRAGDIIINNNNNMFKTLNSVYNSEEPESPSPVEPGGGGEISVETVIRGLRTVDRLFFKPGESETSSILEEASSRKGVKVSESQVKVDENDQILHQSVVMSMDSQDPYIDFKKSMEEMVEAHGLKDWESLEELLCCYLKVNGKNNHGYIIGAFVDLLVTIAFSSSSSSSSSANIITNNSSSSYSPSSPLSFYTSSNFSDDSSSTPCISSLEEADGEEGNSHLCSLLEVENEIKEIN
ncbi:Transcription repressor OFP15 [Euphorbia peplus]|nr:Transcription repressor OFP15 [Euphorbia peplus]